MSDASPSAMTSHRPYLLRALWEWIAENGMTPHLLVDATQPGVRVPSHTVKDGKVVLNIADRAVSRLEMGNEVVTFSARFAGVSHPVSVPVPAILAIYARETGQGMALPEDMVPPATDQAPQSQAPSPLDATTVGATGEGEGGNAPSPAASGDDTPPPRRGPHLRVVK